MGAGTVELVRGSETQRGPIREDDYVTFDWVQRGGAMQGGWLALRTSRYCSTDERTTLETWPGQTRPT